MWTFILSLILITIVILYIRMAIRIVFFIAWVALCKKAYDFLVVFDLMKELDYLFIGCAVGVFLFLSKCLDEKEQRSDVKLHRPVEINRDDNIFL